MGFKLGSESRNNGKKVGGVGKDEASVSGVEIIRKELGPGIDAEANNDGTIFLSEHIEPGSVEERKVLMHEMRHIVDMKTGKLAYTDDDITWMGQTHARADGKIHYNGEWVPEGDMTLPWEQH